MIGDNDLFLFEYLELAFFFQYWYFFIRNYLFFCYYDVKKFFKLNGNVGFRGVGINFWQCSLCIL